jgi:hypothetical protein
VLLLDIERLGKKALSVQQLPAQCQKKKEAAQLQGTLFLSLSIHQSVELSSTHVCIDKAEHFFFSFPKSRNTKSHFLNTFDRQGFFLESLV